MKRIFFWQKEMLEYRPQRMRLMSSSGDDFVVSGPVIGMILLVKSSLPNADYQACKSSSTFQLCDEGNKRGKLDWAKVPLHKLELCSSAPEADALSTELQGRAEKFYHIYFSVVASCRPSNPREFGDCSPRWRTVPVSSQRTFLATLTPARFAKQINAGVTLPTPLPAAPAVSAPRAGSR